jgi:uncharacterized surface anchored protein
LAGYPKLETENWKFEIGNSKIEIRNPKIENLAITFEFRISIFKFLISMFYVARALCSDDSSNVGCQGRDQRVGNAKLFRGSFYNPLLYQTRRIVQTRRLLRLIGEESV